MRKIPALPILVFSVALISCVCGGAWFGWWSMGLLPLGEFRSIAVVTMALLTSFSLLVIAQRVFLAAFPMVPGDVLAGTRGEDVYHVYLLFHLMVFGPIMRSGLVPSPLWPVFYRLLGARIGRNTYGAGVLFDSHFITLGDFTTIGHNSILVPHVLEGQRVAHYPIVVGSNVTVGAMSCVLAGVTIEDNAIVAMGAVVPKGTHIPANEIWGGVPARRIGYRDPSAAQAR